MLRDESESLDSDLDTPPFESRCRWVRVDDVTVGMDNKHKRRRRRPR
jgi:hypothetical protein